MGLGLPTDLHRFSRIFNFSTRQGNYELCIMNYYCPQIAQILKIFHFAQTVKHIIPINSQLSVLNCDVAHRFAQILKITIVSGSKLYASRRNLRITADAGNLLNPFQGFPAKAAILRFLPEGL